MRATEVSRGNHYGLAPMKEARGQKVEANGGELLQFSDAEFVLRVSGEMTGSAYSIIEEIAPLDTPVHVHTNEDELW